MEEEEKKKLAQQLREGMRIERNIISTDKGDRSSVKGRRSSNVEVGPNSENTRGYAKGTSGNTEDIGDNNRSSQDGVERSGSNDRRLGNDRGHTTGRSSEARRIGLERADDIPTVKTGKKSQIREDYFKQAQETVSNVKNAIFAKKGSVLSKKEAEEYYEPLKAAILGTGDDLDKILEWRVQALTHHGLPFAIWSNITDFEADAQTKLMLKRGMENAYAAAVVRRFVEMKDWVTVGVLHLPRIQLSVEVLRMAQKEHNENKNK